MTHGFERYRLWRRRQCTRISVRVGMEPRTRGRALEEPAGPAVGGASMAMKMTGEATLPADRSKGWAMLNDPAVLKACIPGCEALEKTGDNGFAAAVKTKIGPVRAAFKDQVDLLDRVPASIHGTSR